MSKKKSKKKAEAPAVVAENVEAPQPSEQQPVLRRVSVLISEEDLRSMQEHFAARKTGHPLVAVHPTPASKELTPAQREWRKAYRQRPEVKERNKAYRAERRKRLRDAAKQAEAATT